MILPLEPKIKINYAEEIKKLQKSLNAVILAHYYQEPEIQEIADFIGDSLELARKAKTTNADVIVFCGVHFMAETAKILNPEKLVLIPDLAAGCSLADSCPKDEFLEFRKKYPDHIAITYINCSADVKAASDIICTSSNAEKIVRQIPPDKGIIFSPDKNLGKYIMKVTGRDMILWDGACIVHETFNEKKIFEMKIEHPDALLIAHPECLETLLQQADFIGSTSKLLQFVSESPAREFIVATESGILHQMKKAVPNKLLLPAPPLDEKCSCNDCPYMKLNTLEKIYRCMLERKPEINLPEETRKSALIPLEKMLRMS